MFDVPVSIAARNVPSVQLFLRAKDEKHERWLLVAGLPGH
jgi:hypothetical protein